MDIAIVSSLYSSEKYIDEFYSRIVDVVKKHSLSYEIIFVNDGSPDNSISKVLQIQKKDANVILIDLSRNFGHHQAILAGLEESNSHLVFLLDVDLEEEPENLEKFLKVLNESNADVVYGVTESRKGNFGEKIFGYLFYTIFNSLSNIKIPRNITMTRLMKKKY